MKIVRFSSLLALAVVLAPAPLRGQAVPIDLEVGYRFVDVSGSEETYRTQINERPGVLLRSLHLSTSDLNGETRLFDQFRVDAADVGAGPAGAFRLQVGRHRDYLLNFAWRHSEPFSALSGFANPLLSQGMLIGEHTWDRKRNQFDVDLKVLPGRMITPILGYSSNLLYGPGQTTYHLGQDEFRLQQDTTQSDQEIRVGAAFDVGPVSGTLLQGWRKYHANDTLTLVPGAGAGNNPGTVLDKPVSLTTFHRTSPTDINTPTSYAFVRGFLTDHIQLSGYYMHANVSESAGDQESLTGSLVSFQLSRFLQGFQQNIATSVGNTYWRAGGKAEVRIVEGVDLMAQYTERHSELDGQVMIDSLFLGTTTFTGADPKDIQVLLDAATLVERTDKVIEVRASVKSLGPLAVYAGYSQIKQDLTVMEDPSEIVIPGGQSGEFDRTINRVDGGASVSMAGLNLSADVRWDDADRAILRIDYETRTRVRARASFKLAKWAAIGGTGEWITQKNDEPGIASDGKIQNYTADFRLTPVKALSFWAVYSNFKVDSTIPVRIPQDFGVVNSVNAEDGDAWDVGSTILLGPVTLNGSYGRLVNEGTYPFKIDRARVRVDIDVTKNAGIVGEWAYDKYRDTPLPVSDYLANRYGLYLKWRP